MMMVLILFLMISIFTTGAEEYINAENQTSNRAEVRKEQSFQQLPCKYARGLRLGNRSRELECCEQAEQFYETGWGIFYLPLTEYLETLKGWKCPQLQQECERKLFDFTPFTKLLYKYFCEYDELVKECTVVVYKTLISANLRDAFVKQISSNLTNSSKHNAMFYSLTNTSTYVSTKGDQNLAKWSSIIDQIKSTHFTLEELLEPCMQMAQYQADENHRGNYQEVINVLLPFCETSWCGFSGNSLTEHFISRWACMSSRCRVNITIIIAVSLVIAVAITVANVLVIVVITDKKNNRNSQSIYRLSLAFADLLVGVVIFPTCVVTLVRLVMTRYKHSENFQVTGFANGSNISTTVNVRGYAAEFNVLYPAGYIEFVGFFTAVSIFVSVYTLASAGFDRLIAVYRPLQYRKHSAQITARRATIVSWILAIAFSLLPNFVPSLKYGVIVSFLVIISGNIAVILLLVAFGIPLLIVWVINIATFLATRKHSSLSRRLSTSSSNQKNAVERRVARTLVLMVAVFSVSTLPVFAVILISPLKRDALLDLPRTLDLNSAQTVNNINFVAVSLLLCNSLWNFFIYNARNLAFRNGVKDTIKTVTKRMGLQSCWNSVVLSFQSFAHDGSRRLSTLTTLSLIKDRRKSSTTDATKATAGNDLSLGELPTVFALPRNSGEVNLSSNTIICERKESSSKVRTRSTSEKQNELMPCADSIFDSFVNDANASRLFVSVMENIDEGIFPQSNEERNQNE